MMHESIEFYSRALPRHPHDEIRLSEEIAYLEGRLRAMGEEGDCAYERAMSRHYSELLNSRRRELARAAFN